VAQTEAIESRILSSPVPASTPWEFSTLPDAWRVSPGRNAGAGALAAILSLPLAMGLGALAVAPLGPSYASHGVLAGLYACAFLGLMAVLAGARGIAIYAPRSLVSFMIAAVCAQSIAGASWLPKDDPGIVLAALFLVCAMAGAFQVAFAATRLSRLVKFIPTPVLAGFQNAAAIIIVLAQLPIVLGLPSRPAWFEWPAALPQAQPLTLLVGAVTLALGFHGQRLVRGLPPLITALAGGTLLYYALHAAGFSAALGPLLGSVPAAMPDGSQLADIMAVTQRPGFIEALPGLVLGAASIALVASLDVLMSAKALENLSHQRGNATRELFCIGTANAVTPLLGGIAGSISLGPSTANYKSGGRNSLSLFVHAVLFLAFVPLAAPLLARIPLVVVSAVVLHAAAALIDRWTLQLIGRALRGRAIHWASISVDLVVIGLVTAVAVAGEVVLAVGLGVAIAVIVFTLRMSRGVIRATRYGDEVQSRRTRESAHIELLARHGRRILAIELEGPLFFASAEALHNCIDDAIAKNVRYVILDVARVNEIDSTGARILLQASQRMRGASVNLLICGQDEHAQIVALLRHHGVADAITAERSFPDLDRALEWCEDDLLRAVSSGKASEDEYPLALLDIARGFTKEECAALESALVRREFPAGATVFAQGDKGHALYIIVRGEASVRLDKGLGRDRRLVTFSAGTVFGEMALLDQESRSATVIADGPLVCYVLERAAFEEISMLRPNVGIRLLSNLGRELSLRMRRVNRILSGQV
jgi:SulP family sulfate permease